MGEASHDHFSHSMEGGMSYSEMVFSREVGIVERAVGELTLDMQIQPGDVGENLALVGSAAEVLGEITLSIFRGTRVPTQPVTQDVYETPDRKLWREKTEPTLSAGVSADEWVMKWYNGTLYVFPLPRGLYICSDIGQDQASPSRLQVPRSLRPRNSRRSTRSIPGVALSSM